MLIGIYGFLLMGMDIEESIDGKSYTYSISDGRKMSIVDINGMNLKIDLPHICLRIVFIKENHSALFC